MLVLVFGEELGVDSAEVVEVFEYLASDTQHLVVLNIICEDMYNDLILI
jgi:hypothetical protein